VTTREGFLELASSRARLQIATTGADNDVASEWWRSTRDNPAGEGAQLVVRDSGGIVACGKYTPKTFVHNGERVAVAEFGGMYTAPEAQGKGLFRVVVSELENLARERGVVAGYATANNQSGPIFVTKLGWNVLDPWTRWIRPAFPALRSPLDALATARARRPRGTVTVEIAEPGIVDDLDETRMSASHFARSPEQFAWRYPADRYVMARAYVDGALRGWCVAGRTTRLGRPAAAIADWGFAVDEYGLAVPLARAAVRALPGSQLVFGGTGVGGHTPVWRSLLAVGRPAKMPLIGRAITRDASIAMFCGMSFDIGDSDTV
jgi:GNAT superfamily N-acetyltransferase